MTVNFGSVYNVSACSPKYAGQGDVIWNCLKVNMHVDGEDLANVQKILPDFKETDTLSIQSMRGSDNPISNSAISINDAPYVMGIVNAPLMKRIIGILTKVVKSDADAITPTIEFAKSGQLKKDVFGDAAKNTPYTYKQVFAMFGFPTFSKQVAKDIIQDIRINSAVDMKNIFKDAADEKYILPPKRQPELPN